MTHYRLNLSAPFKKVVSSQTELNQNRQSVGQFVLVSGTHDYIFITFRRSRVCWCGTPSLMRGYAYSLQLPLGLANAVFLGSESRRTHGHILLYSNLRSSKLEGQVPAFISPRNRVIKLYLQVLGYNKMSMSWYEAPTWDPRPIFPILSFIIFYDSFGLRWSLLYSLGSDCKENTVSTVRGVEVQLHNCWSRHFRQMSGLIHDPAALPPVLDG
jgi:hypothetical protein